MWAERYSAQYIDLRKLKMSRVGKNPITLPTGVTVDVKGSTVTVKGGKESLSIDIRDEISVDVGKESVEVKRVDDTRTAKSLHGLTRTLISNMVVGVSTGFERKLEIIGVGYRAEVKGDTVNMLLGFSHPIKYKLPKGISASVEKNTLVTLKGADKQKLGQVAAELRAFRPPEPYKGKGVKYIEETVRRKAGKAAKAAGA